MSWTSLRIDYAQQECDMRKHQLVLKRYNGEASIQMLVEK